MTLGWQISYLQQMKQSKYLVVFSFIIVLGIPLLLAQPNEKPRPKIGLVLSGGGAKGLAHIGVLKVKKLGCRLITSQEPAWEALLAAYMLAVIRQNKLKPSVIVSIGMR